MPVSQDATDIETNIETDIEKRLDSLRRLAEQLLNELDEDSRDRDADGAAAAAPVKPAGWLSRLVG